MQLFLFLVAHEAEKKMEVEIKEAVVVGSNPGPSPSKILLAFVYQSKRPFGFRYS